MMMNINDIKFLIAFCSYLLHYIILYIGAIKYTEQFLCSIVESSLFRKKSFSNVNFVSYFENTCKFIVI